MKQLKPRTCSYLFVALLLTGAEFLWGQVKETRVDRTFNVNNSTRLRIDNKFGKVHINTWDQNTIKAEVVVEVEGSEGSARDVLDRINIDVSESGSEINLETEISESNNRWQNQRFRIDYTISMPRSNPLSVEHRHGDVYLDNLDGTVDLGLAHGQVITEELSGRCNISLQHGNGGRIAAIGSGSLEIQHYQRLRIGRLGSMDFEIAHASVEVEETGDLDFEARHSKLEFGSTGMLTLDMQHSSFEAEAVAGISSDMQHSTIDIGRLQRMLEVDCNHSNVKVDWISNDFTIISFDGNHSYLGVELESGANATLEVELDHGKLNYPQSRINMSHVNIENNRREYTGQIGNGRGGRIEVDANFTDVSIGMD